MWKILNDIVILCLLIFGCDQWSLYLQENSLITQWSQKMLRDLDHREKLRLKKEEERRLREGNQKKEPLLHRLDKMILQSGIRQLLPFLNTELYLVFLGGLTIGGEVLLELAAVGTWIKLLFLIGVPLGSYGSLKFMWERNYRRTEEQLLAFMNLIGNYQQSCDDLLSIFGKITYHLEEPLKSAVEECYLYGKITGNLSVAFYELQIRIPHEEFQKLIKNLEICHRHTADYGEIIGDSRGMFLDYLKNKRERRAMKNNARIEIFLILMFCMTAFAMMNRFMTRDLWKLLGETLPGKVLLGYCAGIVFFAIKILNSEGR